MPVAENQMKGRPELSPAKKKLLERMRQGQGKSEGTTASVEAVPQIHRRQLAEPVPLSFSQRRLWLMQQWNRDSSAYNISGAVRLIGPLDCMALEASLTEIVRRHEVLRSKCRVEGETTVQVVEPVPSKILQVMDLRDKPHADRETEAYRQANAEARLPFDLEQGPLFRFRLLQLDSEEYWLLMSFHHIVFDGWSQTVFIHELNLCYLAYSQHREPGLAPLPIQYADYAVWQLEWDQRDRQKRQLAYWTERLAANLSVCEIPADYPRVPRQMSEGARKSRQMSAFLRDEIRQFCRTTGVTPFIFMLAAFKALVYRYTGQTRITIGTPVSGRHYLELEGLIGVCINMLVLHVKIDGATNFRQLLDQVRDATLEAYENQDIPFEQIVEHLNPPRDPSRTPLFQIAFALQSPPAEPLTLAGVTWMPIQVDSGRARFDLTLFVSEPELTPTFVYNVKLYSEQTIDRLLTHYESMLSSIVAAPDVLLQDINLFSEQENAAFNEEIIIEGMETGFDF